MRRTLALAAGAALAAAAGAPGKKTAMEAYSQFLEMKALREASPPPGYGDNSGLAVWPLPSNATAAGPGAVHLDPYDFTFHTGGDPFLDAAAARYYPLILFLPQRVAPPAGAAVLRDVYLNVTNLGVKQIQQGTDESYTLTWAADGSSATISAPTVFGALRGIETLSQLCDGDKWSGQYTCSTLAVVDAPRFPYRGLLVDAARHYLPPALLLRIIDAMSFVKLNTLQIVIGCDWSWTIESRAYPTLTNASYYGPYQDHVYNQSTMVALIEQANLRGVRIIPLLEVGLGHNALSYPELMWCNSKQYSGLPHPLKNETWTFMANLFKDMRGVFADDYINIGGDEIDTSCWTNDTDILAWLSQNGHGSDMDYMTSYFYSKLVSVVNAAGFKPIMWGEAWSIFNATNTSVVGTDIVFDAWSPDTPQGASGMIQTPGAKAIISSYCFLAPVTIPGEFNVPGGATWATNYACDVQNISGVPPEALNNILGGHESRWGEETDGTNLFQFSWPAIFGVSEKLWTPYAQTLNPPAREYALNTDVRCRMVRRGVATSPQTYSWSCPHEYQYDYPPPAVSNDNNFPLSATKAEARARGDVAGARARLAAAEAELAAARVALAAAAAVTA